MTTIKGANRGQRRRLTAAAVRKRHVYHGMTQGASRVVQQRDKNGPALAIAIQYSEILSPSEHSVFACDKHRISVTIATLEPSIPTTCAGHRA